MSGASDVRKNILSSAKDNRYASTVRGTTANTMGAELLSTPPMSKEYKRSKVSQIATNEETTSTVMQSNTLDCETHRNKLWKIQEVQVGYDDQLATKFNLEGKNKPAVFDIMPELNVDTETPYAGMREKMERDKAAAQFTWGERVQKKLYTQFNT